MSFIRDGRVVSDDTVSTNGGHRMPSMQHVHVLHVVVCSRMSLWVPLSSCVLYAATHFLH